MQLFSINAGLKFRNAPSQYENIDAQIHEQVYSAQELIVCENEALLKKLPTVEAEKSERMDLLNNLGFGNSTEVKECIS